jgi:lipopolysaccharide export LptBFGC system permease protein LptF
MHKNCLLSIFILLVIASCTSEKERNLCKRWEVKNVIFMNEKTALVQSDTMQGDMQKVTREILRNILMKNIYEFNEDGTYKTGNAAAVSSGRWDLDGNTIVFKPESGKDEKEKKVPFEKLTSDSFILVMKNDQTSFELKLVLTPLPVN